MVVLHVVQAQRMSGVRQHAAVQGLQVRHELIRVNAAKEPLEALALEILAKLHALADVTKVLRCEWRNMKSGRGNGKKSTLK